MNEKRNYTVLHGKQKKSNFFHPLQLIKHIISHKNVGLSLHDLIYVLDNLNGLVLLQPVEIRQRNLRINTISDFGNHEVSNESWHSLISHFSLECISCCLRERDENDWNPNSQLIVRLKCKENVIFLHKIIDWRFSRVFDFWNYWFIWFIFKNWWPFTALAGYFTKSFYTRSRLDKNWIQRFKHSSLIERSLIHISTRGHLKRKRNDSN